MRLANLKRQWRRIVGLVIAVAVAGSTFAPAYAEEPISESPSDLIQARSIDLAGDYTDGTYEGTGIGHFAENPIQVNITIASNRITAINVIKQNETESKWNQAVTLIEAILGANSTDVDGVSGATDSCNGIKAAVNDALSKALNSETQVFDGGNGSKSSPYLIANAVQLQRFADKVNAGNNYEDKYIELSSDVSVSGEWNPIGTAKNNAFAGSFSGAGHEISGIAISSDLQYAGLFGYLGAGAAVSDIELSNTSITTATGAAVYAGAVAGYVDKGGIIRNCKLSGAASASAAGAKMSYTGGVAGALAEGSVVANCYVDVAVTAASGSSGAYAGGITGISNNKCVIINTASLGDVSTHTGSNSYSVAGGIAGTQSGTVYNVYSLGEASSAGSDPAKCLAGGISGMITANTAMINAYYNDLNTKGFMTSAAITGYITDNIGPVSQGNMQTEEFTEKLNNGLKKASIASGAAKISDAVKPNMGDLQSAISSVGSLNAWKFNGASVLSDKAFVDDTIDTSIFEKGKGTEEEPYIIKTEAQLRAFAKSLSDDVGYDGIHIALDGDIDVSSEQWTPIGLGRYDFRGIFDGKGHAVKGMFIGTKGSPYEESNSDSSNNSKMTTFYGFFGVVGKNGVIKNLGIEDASITVKRGSSVYAGLLAGLTDKGYIDSCHGTGYVYSETTHQKANAWAGGLIGQTVRGGVINSWTDSEVYCAAIGGLSEAGSFIGMTNRSVVANCFALGNTAGKASRENGNEGMPAVSSFIGVHGGKMANCYAAGNMKADSFSTYVGAVSGWSTGIARQFISYYNSEAIQNSNGTVNNPVVDVGFMVSAGVNDEGEPYDGTYHVGIVKKTSSELKSEAFAALLNSNHDAFPLDIVNGESSNTGEQNAMGLPGFMKLRSWQIVNGIVMPSGGQVSTTYKDMTPKFEPDSLAVADGVYQGRAKGPSGKYLYVEMTVASSRITKIRIMENGEGEALESVAPAVIDSVIATQNYAQAEADSAMVKTLKSAVASAAKKAANRDLTGYGPASPSIFAAGDGTKTNPFIINTSSQLKAFAESVNEDEHYEGKFIKLGSDISLAGINWVPVGGPGAYGFRGTFDGNQKVIKDMTIGSANLPEVYCKSVGLFANLEAAKIKNLGIEKAVIYHKYMGDSISYAGLLAGYAIENAGNGSYIDFCYVKGGEIYSQSAKQNDSGGLLGTSNFGTIANCYTDVVINAKSRDGYSYAGGLVGLPNRSAIVNNYALGSITGAGNGTRVQIGGIAGMNAGVAVNNYASVSLFSGNTTVDIGGFAGRVSGIAYVEKAYYSKESAQKSGAADISPVKGVGTIVAGSNYGKGTVTALEGRTGVELKSEGFANLLNKNKNDGDLLKRTNAVLEGLGSKIAAEVILRDWSYSAADGGVVFADRVTKSSTGGPRKSGTQNNPAKDNKAAENTAVPSGDAAKALTDIGNHWAADAIGKAVDRKLFSGVSKTEFAPNNTMTRAMFVTVLGRLAGAEGVHTDAFKDVKNDSWYAGYVGWANSAGIINGISSNEFGANGEVSREQMAVMLYNFARVKGLSLSGGGDAGFSDGDRISSWAKEAVSVMNTAGVINGRDSGSFDPQGKATRAEAAAMLVRFMEKYKL